MPEQGPAGHRAVAHTADMAIEAWAPTRAGCYAEAVRALVGAIADTSGAVAAESAPLRIAPAPDEDQLVELLDEVIFLLDVQGVLPVEVVVEEAPDGGLQGRLDLASLDADAFVGAAPKAVSRADLSFGFDGERWTCYATIDV